MSESKKTRNRGVRASRVKLHQAMLRAGVQSQIDLAAKIAEREGLQDAPRQLVSKVMRERAVDMRSLTRIAAALKIKTYALLLSEEDVDSRMP